MAITVSNLVKKIHLSFNDFGQFVMRYYLLLVALISFGVHAKMYKWIDADDNVYYSDQKPTDDIEILEIKGHVNTYTPIKLPPIDFSDRPKNNSKPKRITKKGEVILFSINRCKYCNMAKEYFRLNNIAYQELNIQQSAQAKALFVKAGGKGGVPFTVVGKESKEIKIAGFTKTKFDKVFK